MILTCIYEGDEEGRPEPEHIRPLGHGPMIYFLKIERTHSLEQRDYWTANAIQNAILAFLDEIGRHRRLDDSQVSQPNAAVVH